jgi:hypothetical protein
MLMIMILVIGIFSNGILGSNCDNCSYCDTTPCDIIILNAKIEFYDQHGKTDLFPMIPNGFNIYINVTRNSQSEFYKEKYNLYISTWQCNDVSGPDYILCDPRGEHYNFIGKNRYMITASEKHDYIFIPFTGLIAGVPSEGNKRMLQISKKLNAPAIYCAKIDYTIGYQA